MSLITFSLLFQKKRRGKEKIFEFHVHPGSRLMDQIWVLLGLRLIFRIEVYEVRMLRLG
jgi:hypothetical protein